VRASKAETHIFESDRFYNHWPCAPKSVTAGTSRISFAKSPCAAVIWGCPLQSHCLQLEIEDIPCKIIVCSHNLRMSLTKSFIYSQNLWMSLTKPSFAARICRCPFRGIVSADVCTVVFWLRRCLRPFARSGAQGEKNIPGAITLSRYFYFHRTTGCAGRRHWFLINDI
jgi:hypothetical protein